MVPEGVQLDEILQSVQAGEYEEIYVQEAQEVADQVVITGAGGGGGEGGEGGDTVNWTIGSFQHQTVNVVQFNWTKVSAV